MPTLNQLIRHGREEKWRTNRTRALDQSAETPHFDASGSRGKSALDERKEEVILSNIKRSRGWPKSCGFQCDNQFELIEEMKKEAGAKKEDCPATNSAFNGIREYQSHVQDGRGGGKPNDFSNREADP